MTEYDFLQGTALPFALADQPASGRTMRPLCLSTRGKIPSAIFPILRRGSPISPIGQSRGILERARARRRSIRDAETVLTSGECAGSLRDPRQNPRYRSIVGATPRARSPRDPPAEKSGRLPSLNGRREFALLSPFLPLRVQRYRVAEPFIKVSAGRFCSSETRLFALRRGTRVHTWLRRRDLPTFSRGAMSQARYVRLYACS